MGNVAPSRLTIVLLFFRGKLHRISRTDANVSQASSQRLKKMVAVPHYSSVSFFLLCHFLSIHTPSLKVQKEGESRDETQWVLVTGQLCEKVLATITFYQTLELFVLQLLLLFMCPKILVQGIKALHHSIDIDIASQQAHYYWLGAISCDKS